MFFHPVCKELNSIKYGLQKNGVQKFFCKICKAIFNERFGTPLYRMKTKDKEFKEIVHLFFKGLSIADIADVKDVSEDTIRSILKKTVKHFEKFEDYKTNYDENYIPEVIEVDEIHIKLQNSIEFYGWIAYDPKNKILIDFQIGQRDEKTLDKLFRRLQKYRTKIKLVMIDGYKGFEKLIRKYLCKKRFHPLTGVINKSKYVKELNGYLTYALFGYGRISVEELIKEYKLGNKISTALIERLNRDFRDDSPYMKRRSHKRARILDWVVLSFKGIRFIHNVCKAHNTLSEKSSKNWIIKPVTPFMKAGVCDKFLSIFDVIKTPIVD
jgi:transposase-like protein/IS1 family transposase